MVNEKSSLTLSVITNNDFLMAEANGKNQTRKHATSGNLAAGVVVFLSRGLSAQ